MTDGTETIDGELWYVAAEDLEVTLAVLDEIECFGNDNVDLYVRRTIRCQLVSGEIAGAYAYFYAQPDELDDRAAVAPDSDGKCRWSAQSASE